MDKTAGKIRLLLISKCDKIKRSFVLQTFLLYDYQLNNFYELLLDGGGGGLV